MRRIVPLVIVPAVLSCGAPTAPRALADAVRFAPPAWYAAMYTRLEVCSGLQGDYARVRWMHAPGSRVPQSDAGGWAAAMTFPDTHTIVIADFYLGDTVVVEHEAMHDLSRSVTHPPRFFDGSCGDLMP